MLLTVVERGLIDVGETAKLNIQGSASGVVTIALGLLLDWGKEENQV